MNWREVLKQFYKDTFRLHHWTMTAKSLEYREEMEKSQWLSIKKIKELQFKKLQKLLRHAYHNVPYYKMSLNRNNIKLNHIQTFEDLRKIPLLDKIEVKKYANSALLSKRVNFVEVLKVRTSGSTGMPLHIYVDIKQLDMRYAAVLRCWGWAGWKFGDKSIRLWHQTIGMDQDQVAKEWLDAFLMRREFLPVFEMTDKNLAKYILKIKEYQPKIMDGYAEAFDILANFIRTNRINDVFVPVVISSAQMLPDQIRKNITKHMHAEVYDRYGSREFSTIAHECSLHKGFHVNAENLIVEIIKNGENAKEGEIGEAVITDLNNFSQPLIRYRIGDLVKCVQEKCHCGRGLPLIGKISGRVKTIILGTNGRYLSHIFFHHYLKEYENEIRKFQVIQEKQNLLIIKIIPENLKEKFSRKSRSHIIADLKRVLGSDMKIDFEITDNIEMIKTGKQLSVISKLKIDFQDIEKNNKNR